MSVTVTVNNTNYTIPQTDETGWGDNVTSWIQAISSATLQKSGGTFTLSAEVDFGASFGLKSLYFKGRTSNPAAAGILRLAVSDSVGWRNNANSGNLLLAVNGSDALTFNGVVLTTNSDTIPVSRGGTNITSYTVGDLIYASGATTLSKLAIGTAGQVLKTNGGATAPEWGSAASALAVAAKTGNYTLQSTDDAITCDSDGGAFTVTLPDCASNAGKVFTIKKIGTSFATANAVAITRAGSDTIFDYSSATTTNLHTPGEEIQICSFGGTVWQVLNRRIPSVPTAYTPTISAGFGTTSISFCNWTRRGSWIKVQGRFSTGTVAGSNGTITLPSGLLINDNGFEQLLGLFLPNSTGGATAFSTQVANIFYDGSDETLVYVGKNTASNVFEKTNVSAFCGNTQNCEFSFEVQISGWNG